VPSLFGGIFGQVVVRIELDRRVLPDM
jgi:hypothetical protein